MSEQIEKKTTEESPKKATTSTKESLFYVHELREHSRELFKVNPEVLDAALMKVNSNQITKSQAKTLIKEFLNKKVTKKGADKK